VEERLTLFLYDFIRFSDMVDVEVGVWRWR